MIYPCEVYDIIKKYYKIVSEKYETVGVFLFGSQNYRCQTDASDVDAKAIVIPPVQNLLMDYNRIHETIKTDYGEITIFDIRDIHKDITKQNINFVEILFTEYMYINPKYKNLYQPLIENRERIARLDTHQCIRALYGNLMNKYDKVFKAVPSNELIVNTFGYDNKALADIYRYADFMERYMNNTLYAQCLVPENLTSILHMKTHHELAICEVRTMLETLKLQADSLKEVYLGTTEHIIDTETVDMINNVTLDCLKAYLKDRSHFETWPILLY